MTESIYKEFENKYYNPDDNDKRPGENDNWKSIQEGFSKISTTQLETSKGLTLGKGTTDETSVSAAELKAMKEGGSYRIVEVFYGEDSDPGDGGLPYKFNYDLSEYNGEPIYIKIHVHSTLEQLQFIICDFGNVTKIVDGVTENMMVFESGVDYSSEQPEIVLARVNFFVVDAIYGNRYDIMENGKIGVVNT